MSDFRVSLGYAEDQFVMVPVAVLAAPVSPGARLCWMALRSFAYAGDHTACHPTQTQLADRLGIERSDKGEDNRRRTIRRYVADLEAAGLLRAEHHREQTKDGMRTWISYTLLPPGQECPTARTEMSHKEEPVRISEGGGMSPTEGSGTNATDAGAREHDEATQEAAVVVEQVIPTWSFGKKKVPLEARATALACFEAYVVASGQRMRAFTSSGGPSDALKRITGAVLDHPDVSTERWGEVVRDTLASPWWSGPPSVGVVFGPAVVEKNLARPAGKPDATGKPSTFEQQMAILTSPEMDEWVRRTDGVA